ncbi:uncharacterized protein NEMAJ01_1715 [Nematocida major]|uniref:uncharacterized protein n=1 Tax=Nematocida major TaxID=1912982 RepID=UPI0020087954|nr:uncharacterized protein NEMAJ01_1715 [Nematocida major]KAH9386819.1 hypothetical protein NEMAJ01_1715 [Nematocida major]
MLLSFHRVVPHSRRVTNPTEHVTLEESLDMPGLEEVDVLPCFMQPEHTESAKLEEAGADILNKLYTVEVQPSTSIKCKGMSREEYRF